MSGLSWLFHLSLHCLPILPGKDWAIRLQLPSPFSCTNLDKTGAAEEPVQEAIDQMIQGIV